MGHAMRKCVLGHMWTAKAQISLHIHAVWLEPSLITQSYWILQNVWWESKGPDYFFEHTQENLNLHISHLFEGTFLLDLAHIMIVIKFVYFLAIL